MINTDAQAGFSIAAAPRSGRSAGRAVAALLREPLLHFAILAGLIFGADQLLHPPSKSERVITVTSAMRQQLIDMFDEDKQRKPSPEQLQKLIDFWVATEILYREGKAMGLDRGDDMIKARVAHKLQLLIFSDIEVAAPSEEQLANWFAANRERYDAPQRLDFYLAPAKSEQDAHDLVARIAQGQEPASLQDQARAFKARPAPSVVSALGAGFLQQLLALPRGEWRAIQSTEGWHVARLDGVEAAAPADLAAIRATVEEDWKADETRRRALAAVDRLKASYSIRYEDAP